MRPVFAATVALALSTTLPALPHAAEEPDSNQRVLVLQSFAQGVEPYSTISGIFQRELARTSPKPVDVQEASLGTSLTGGAASEAVLVEYLESLNAERGFDLVVTFGAPATRFVQRNRARLFSATPLLIAGTDQRHLEADSLHPDDSVVPTQVDLTRVFDNILTVLPKTERVVVVLGASPLERYWKEQIAQDVRDFAARIDIRYTDEIPFDQILKRVATLPPRTAILFGRMDIDAAGVPYRGDDALVALRAAAKAPLFGIFDYQLGKGIVGGPLVSLDDAGRESADAALRILQAGKAAGIRHEPIGPGAPVFDDRELSRWKIQRSALPAGSTIEYRQPTLWEAYKWRLIGVAALCAGQAFLIAGLLLNRARRKRAEDGLRRSHDAVRDLSHRLVSAQEEERSRLARELHDDVTQRLARLAIDVGGVEQKVGPSDGRETLGEVRDGLARLSEDVHALSYSLHPSLLEDLGLTEALQVECEKFSQQSAIPVNLTARDMPDSIPNGVSLCLFRIAQEALRNVERHSRAHSVEMSVRGHDGGVRLVVRDDGVGIDPALNRGQPGLGLMSMRERTRMFSGTLELDSRPGQGTAVTAFVPLQEVRP